MNETAWDGSSSILPTVPTAWSIAAVGRFSSYNMDLVWQNTSTGERSIWLMNGSTWSGSAALLPTVPTAWSIAGAGDFNGDGNPDIVWQNTSTGERAIWLMNGPTYNGTNAMLPTVPVQWSIAAVGDFNADAKPDLVWQNTTTGERSIWFMNGISFGPITAPLAGSSASLGSVPVQWVIAGADDFNEDGQTDIVWQNTSTGERSIWLMDGATHTGNFFLPTIPAAWRIAGAFDLRGRPCSTDAVDAPPNSHPGVSPSLAFGSLALTDCTLPDGSFADTYTFTLPFPTEVQIDQRSNTLDSYLGIANSAGTIVATNDDGGGGVNGVDSRIHTVLAAGTYTLWANSFFSRATGDYSLTLASACQLAIPVTPPTLGQTVPTFSGTLVSSDCRGSPFGTGYFSDRYLLSVAVPTEVQVQMTSGAFSPWITLMSSDGGTNLFAGSPPAQRVLSPGNYIISAEGLTTASTGAYGLSVLGPCQYSTTLAVPAIGAAATTLSGTIADSDCRFTDGTFADAYTFTLTAVSTVTIDLKSPDATIDAFMYLYYANGKIIAFDDDGGAVGFDSQIVKVLAPGTYTIWANTYGAGAVGNYTVSLFHNN
jgi:hypothetical protein